MLKAKLILSAVKIFMWCVAVGIGIWYLSSSINGDSITYTSLTGFLQATGACAPAANGAEAICDISKSNGCFLCPYITQLFNIIGVATKDFWEALLGNLWILLALGFIVFLFIHTFKFFNKYNKANATLHKGEYKLPFKEWFDPVQNQFIRVLLVGVFLGALGFGGVTVLKAVSDITIRPVMYVGAELAMAATGTVGAAHCPAMEISAQSTAGIDIIGPALRPFMCVVGNISTVILAGASAGFSLMNFSWMGMGGGMLTWMSGLALVIMFLILGFRIFFDILNVVFRLIFIIIFLPIFIASYAFANTWGILKGAVGKGVEMLVNCATRVVAITLKVLIIYAVVVFAADEYGFSAITPPVIAGGQAAGSSKNIAIAAIFEKCEKVSLIDGVMNKNLFKACWDVEKAIVEMREPRAFDFMKNGWEFLMLMFGIFFIYFYVVEKKIDDILVKDSFSGKDGALNLGSTFKEFGQKAWAIPEGIAKKVTDVFKKK